MPLLAVCVEEKIYFCAGPKTQKARNLARDSRCVLTTAAEGVDVVVEGRAVRVTDSGTLARAAHVLRLVGMFVSLRRYGWAATGSRADIRTSAPRRPRAR